MFKSYGCAIAIALLATGAAAGCGGDDEEPLSKAEHIKQGDALCKKYDAEIEKQVKEMFPDLGENERPSEEQLKTFTGDVIVPEGERLLGDLRDLSQPEGDEDTLNAIYDGFDEALAKVEDDPKVLLSDEDPFEAPSKAAGDYGFKECSD